MHDLTATSASSQSTYPSPRRKWLASYAADLRAGIILTILALAVCWPWIFGNRSFYGGDFGCYFWPQAHLTGNSLRAGVLPLWNPYILSGTPLISNPQASLFYPTNVLQWVLSPAQFLMVSMSLHLLLAGLGGYLFLRRGLLALESGPALLGATAMMLNGFFIAKMQFPNMLHALAYVPLLLFLTERTVRHPGKRRYLLSLAAALALQILASHPQITVFTGYLMLAVGIHAWVCRSERATPGRVVLRTFASAGALALALSCAAWLPVFELLRVASRQSLGVVQANRFYLPVPEITNLFWPQRYSDLLITKPSMVIGAYVEPTCYAGIVPCLLALVGIFVQVRRRTKGGLFWVFVFELSLWLGLGVYGVLYIAAFCLVPGLDRFNDPARLLVGTSIALPVLAAIGLQAVCGWLSAAYGNSRRNFMFLGVLATCLTVYDLGGFTRNFYAVKPVAEVEAMGRAPGLKPLKADEALGSGNGRILRIAVGVTPTVGNYGGSPQVMADKTHLARWSQTLHPNIPSAAGLHDVGGYDPFVRRDTSERLNEVQSLLITPATQDISRRTSEALSSVSARLVSCIGDKPLPARDFLQLWKTTTLGPGRFQYFYYNRNFTPRARASGGHTAAIERDELNLVEIALPTARQPYTASLADTPHAGWHAYLDGNEIPWQAEGSLRVVQIPSSGNTHTGRKLSFVFAPESLRFGLFISLCTLAGLVACLTWPRKCR